MKRVAIAIALLAGASLSADETEWEYVTQFCVACAQPADINLLQGSDRSELAPLREELLKGGMCGVLPPGIYLILNRNKAAVQVRYEGFRIWIGPAKTRAYGMDRGRGAVEVAGGKMKKIGEVDIDKFTVGCLELKHLGTIVESIETPEKVNELLDAGQCALIPPALYVYVDGEGPAYHIQIRGFRLFVFKKEKVFVDLGQEWSRRLINGQ